MWWLLVVLLLVLAALLALTPLVDARRQRILRRCLRDVCDVLNAHGIDYWCDFGTLLGYYRDGDVIRTDYDVDLCLLVAEHPKLLVLGPRFKDRGYTLADVDGHSKLVIRIWDDRTRYYVDVYLYRPDGPLLRSLYRSVEDVPLSLVADRIEVPFLGGTVRVPRDVEALLLHRYGPAFRTPRRGDQGLAYGYSNVETFVRILENNCIGIWSILRAR